MKPLYNSLISIFQKMDGHSHFFDHKTYLEDMYKYPDKYQKIVGFADIILDELDKYDNGQIIKYYDRFIKEKYNSDRHILLAAADNAADAIAIYKKYPSIIKGFGEFKCYKTYKGKDIDCGNLNWIRPVLEFDKQLKLPVYIHWGFEIPRNVYEFESILKDYPEIPIVLCHAGFGMETDPYYRFVLDSVNQLMKYPNLYLDISYKALTYFSEHPEDLNMLLPWDRVFIGSDLNPNFERVVGDIDEKVEDVYGKMEKLQRFSLYHNMRKFFEKKPKYINDQDDQFLRIISDYTRYIEYLPKDQQQHFLTRLNLLMPVDTSKCFSYVHEEASEILQWLNKKQYKKIIKKYVMRPYMDSIPSHKEIKKWLLGITDENLLEILSVGMYVDRYSILKRNGQDSPGIPAYDEEFFNKVYHCEDLKEHEPTLYINCLGYLYNLGRGSEQLWLKACDEMLSQEMDYDNIYGLTHILIQASNFYTKQITDDYAKAINICKQVLNDCKSKGYNKFRADMLCELALCLKYTGKKHAEYDDVVKYLKGISNGILFTDKLSGNKIEDLEHNEHTNALYIQLLKDNRFIL